MNLVGFQTPGFLEFGEIPYELTLRGTTVRFPSMPMFNNQGHADPMVLDARGFTLLNLSVSELKDMTFDVFFHDFLVEVG